MKVIVDFDSCAAHGECVIEAPEIFALADGEESVTVLDPEPGEELRAKVQAAADACPVIAIRLED
jgi:ferredoxin